MHLGGVRETSSPVFKVAAVLTLPFDVVKTQRQIQLGDMETLQGETWELIKEEAPVVSLANGQ